MSSPSTAPRPSVMQLAIKEKAALYAAYIPFFAEGGIFVPTQRDYKLGDDVYVLLTLPDDTQRYPVAGRVAWVTPARAAGNRTQGVGIQFPKDEKSRQLKAKIEELLGTALGSDRPTQTICPRHRRPRADPRWLVGFFVFHHMFTDSHCHLNFPELVSQLPAIRQAMAEAQVTRALCICTTMEEFEGVHALALAHDNFWSTVGVHPDNEGVTEPSVQDLLDRAARACGKPLIIHTRSASDDTLAILQEEGEDGAGNLAGGVFHCFTESMQVARAALDRGYYISFSGIVTFKSAQELRDVVAFVPLDRMLIETDSPYLAPVPYRGKTNNPSYVPHVARQVAETKGLALEVVAEATSRNFDRLFPEVMA